MSDVLSQASGASKVTNRNKERICGYCGKVEKDQYARHYKTHHPDEERIEWDKEKPDIPLSGVPWCSNWKDVIFKGDEAVDRRPEFKPSFKAANSKKRSVAGSVRNPSLPPLSQYGDDNVEMKNIIPEEEEKVAVGPPQFGHLENNKILGKRPHPTTTLIQGGDLTLEQVVQQELPPLNQALGPQSKRSNVVGGRLSAKSLNNLPRASMEQKQKTPCSEGQEEFQVPLPVVQTIYVKQGMRDQEAIQKLIVLEKNIVGTEQERVLELIKLTSMFAQGTVTAYIESNKHNLLNIKDLLILAQSKVDLLSNEEISSIAFASVLFGGSAWKSLPNMFNSLEPAKLEDVLSFLEPLLTGKFNYNLSQWICTSWKYLEEQTLGLLRYLKEQQHYLEDILSANIATISRIVQIVDVTRYLTVTEVFSRSPSFKLVMATLKTSAPQWKSEQKKLSFDQYVALVDFLTESKNKYLIQANEQDLLGLPMTQWMDKLTELQKASLICDSTSIQYRLNQLCTFYGPLSKVHAIDLCISGDARYSTTLHEVFNPPNALQFANAQYAAFALKDRSRQLWCIPSGQGKSRVLATIALILLLASSTNNVHLVFDSLHLMNRDQREFSPWFDLHGILGQVEFHVGLNFECTPGDIFLFDEADELILSDPAKFITKIQHFRCICLTATPDNEDNKGIERAVLKYMGFTFFNGQSALNSTTSSSLDSSLSQTLSVSPDNELIPLIKNELKEYAVVLYCLPLFLELLIAANIPFIHMKDGDDTINDEFLRTLDNRGHIDDGNHTLIVATSSFGMRGFDYRSQKGITLIIAASFANQRQAMQGLHRVGRFGDPCRRLIAKDVALIDKEQSWKHTATLNQFMSQHQKTKVVAYLPAKEEKSKKQAAVTTATITNTAKSTPAVGKSKKEKQQQSNSSSQSTLTMLPKKDLNRRQVQLLAGNGAQISMITTPAGKKVEEQDEVEEEEGIMITASQLL